MTYYKSAKKSAILVFFIYAIGLLIFIFININIVSADYQRAVKWGMLEVNTSDDIKTTIDLGIVNTGKAYLKKLDV